MTLFLISWYVLVVVLVVLTVVLVASELQSMRYKYISKQEYIKKKEENNERYHKR